MTSQEQAMIDGLMERVRTTTVQGKDTQAEQHIQQGLSSSPDALYILVQTVLVQQYGLEQAQSQINELKRQVQSLQQGPHENAAPSKTSSGSFLSHIFGSGSQQVPQTPQQAGYQPVNNTGYGAQGYPPPPPPPYQQQVYPSSGGNFGGGGGMFSGGGGFLRGAMQTAAGVAAGELMFQGMEDIFRGFGGGGHERGFNSGSGETVVNNYYGDDDRSGDRGTGNDQNFYNPDNDASRNDLGSTDDNDFADNSSEDLSPTDSLDSSDFDMGGGDDFSSDNS